MRIVLTLMLALLWTGAMDAKAEGCTFDSKSIRKSGVYFLVPKPTEVDILNFDAKKVFDSLVKERASSFTCAFSQVEGVRDEDDLFDAKFRKVDCVNTKTQVAWNPREFQYMTRAGEPSKDRGNQSQNLSAGAEDFVVLDNDGVGHFFSFGEWQPGVLDRSIQRSEATRRGGEYLDRSRGAYRHRFDGHCSGADQFVLYSVTELFYPQEVQNRGRPVPRTPMIMVAKESEGSYVPAALSETKSPAF